MSKKVTISLVLALCVVAVLLILCWTLFGLSSVSVEFHSTTINLAQTTLQQAELEQEILNAAQFKMGASVLFEGKKKYVSAIENAAQNNPKLAYLRVLNIETVFPNKFVVHVAEREELFALKTNVEIAQNQIIVKKQTQNQTIVKNQMQNQTIAQKQTLENSDESAAKAAKSASVTAGARTIAEATENEFDEEKTINYIICDHDFRVLRVVDQNTWQSQPLQLIEIDGLDIQDKTIRVGQFLKFGQAGMKKFYSAMMQNNRTVGELLGKFSKIEVGQNTDSFTQEKFDSILLRTRGGRQFVINNIDFALAGKVQLMFAVESALFENVDENGFVTSNGKIVELMETDQGRFVQWDGQDEEKRVQLSVQLLAQCHVEIDNLTLSPYVSRTEKDIYYCLVKDA